MANMDLLFTKSLTELRAHPIPAAAGWLDCNTPLPSPKIESSDCTPNCIARVEMSTPPLTAISLFSGAGGDTIGLERAGFKVIAFNEYNKAAIETHKRNFPSSVLLANPTNGAPDITKVPDSVFAEYAGKATVVFAGFPCFVKDTLVLTKAGYKPIQDVTLDDTLLTHTGQFQPIVNLQRKSYSGTLHAIRIKYHPLPIHATDEHPFYVREMVRTWNNGRRSYDVSFKAPEWKKANELTNSHYYGMAVNQEAIVPEFTIPHQINKSKTIHVPKKLESLDEWFMMGYFLGDGWIQDTQKSDHTRFAHVIRFSINDADTETVLPRLTSVLPITPKQKRSGKCEAYGCSDLTWWTILKEFGKYAHGKRIPEWVQSAPPESIRAFLDGYIAADGCARGQTSMTTVSADIAFGLQRLYLKLGQFASVTKTARPSTCVIEGRTVNQRDTYGIRVSDAPMRYSSFLEGAYAWFAPASITTTEVVNEPVFNFEVETDNSYCVENTLVHNCQGFSRAGKKSATDPRNQMYNHFVRVVKNVQPRFLIGENVTGLVNFKSGPADSDPLVIENIQKAFAEIGYTLTWKVQEATDFGVPQKRKRLLIIGHRTNEPFDAASFWAAVAARGAQAGAGPTLRSFVTASLVDAHPIQGDQVPEGFDAVALEVPAGLTPSGTPHPYVVLKANEKLLSCSKRDSPIHSEVVNLDKPSKTIICTYDHQPRLLVGLRRGEERWVRTMAADELKQIQGFPADYELLGNKKERVVQVGNAVPPAMVAAVAAELKARM